ncbi:MAG: hypothetical protein DRO93_02380 [Candidatus Thorarchaeota archaeon]|nr:MAG: hypothetical protein DRO93_02380 [Candidatus Thorarchaeota archaeon]
MDIIDSLPSEMVDALSLAAHHIRDSKRVLAISHIDADGITSLAIVISLLEREGKEFEWRNIHQLNTETMSESWKLIQDYRPDLVVFSDLGTGQMRLIRELVESEKSLSGVIVLDHHLPQEEGHEVGNEGRIIEVNPHNHGLSGSYDVSGAGVAFLLALMLNPGNYDLSELAIVGATGDLQRYYGKGFVGVNKDIVELAQRTGVVRVYRDLTFFGINTRPLPFLLEFSTEPFIPGLTGERDACYAFFENRQIPLKDEEGNWRVWTDLSPEEKRRAVQGLIEAILEAGYDQSIAQGIIGDVVELLHRPPRSEMRNAKEFSTLLNACGRNSKAEVGVRICLNDQEAYAQGRTLLQVHRQNLADALRRLEEGGYRDMGGMYVVQDPDTPDTIIGIVIGMAQGSRIVPTDKPVIGIATRESEDSPYVKISGRAHKSLIKRGINLKEVFVEVARTLNKKYDALVVEAGGHPMAAGAFVHTQHLDEFLKMVSRAFSEIVSHR